MLRVQAVCVGESRTFMKASFFSAVRGRFAMYDTPVAADESRRTITSLADASGQQRFGVHKIQEPAPRLGLCHLNKLDAVRWCWLSGQRRG